MALGDLPQPAKALVKAVVNLERCGEKRNGSLLWTPAACSKAEGAQFVFLTIPFKGFA